MSRASYHPRPNRGTAYDSTSTCWTPTLRVQMPISRARAREEGRLEQCLVHKDVRVPPAVGVRDDRKGTLKGASLEVSARSEPNALQFNPGRWIVQNTSASHA